MKARPEMEQRQWDLLNEKLSAAEQAWQRYESLRPAKSDQRERPASPALALAGMGNVAEGASLAPLLVLLAAFWPVETAGPGMDPPRWQGPLLDYEGKLRELSEAAKQVQFEIEASGGGRRKRDTWTPPQPVVRRFPYASNQVEGGPPWRPCEDKGTGGPGPSMKADAPWVRCTYQCGICEVEYYVFGRDSELCKEKKSLDKAEDLARRLCR